MRTFNAVPLSVEPTMILSRCLWQWLAIGVLLSILLPVGPSPWIGPLWLWGVAAPAVSLLTLHRDTLAAAWQARVIPGARSRATPAITSWRAPSRTVKARRSRPLGHRPWSPSRAA